MVVIASQFLVKYNHNPNDQINVAMHAMGRMCDTIKLPDGATLAIIVSPFEERTWKVDICELDIT